MIVFDVSYNKNISFVKIYNHQQQKGLQESSFHSVRETVQTLEAGQASLVALRSNLFVNKPSLNVKSKTLFFDVINLFGLYK